MLNACILQENPLMGRQNSGSRAANRGETNTWKKVGKKITQIWPLIWPKNSLPLQLNVIFCVLLLVAGRVVNVYTPIFSKKIGWFRCLIITVFILAIVVKFY